MLFNKMLQTIKSNPEYHNVLKKMNPILFDVSLRDGIQNAKVENYPTAIKRGVFHDILERFSPTNLEIGSFVNPNILPIMNDTLELYKYSKNTANLNTYVLIPSIKKLDLAIENKITHLSFITSVSNVFQVKNTGKSLNETKYDFKTLFQKLSREPEQKYTTKLYISCINRCPLMGEVPEYYIIGEIMHYYENYPFTEFCISDTCGTLDFENFKFILESCKKQGISFSKFSLHLHISPENIANVEKIMFYCFENEINKFDVSYLETGGCSVTIKEDKICQNLSYELFYSILLKYIENRGKK